MHSPVARGLWAAMGQPARSSEASDRLTVIAPRIVAPREAQDELAGIFGVE